MNTTARRVVAWAAMIAVALGATACGSGNSTPSSGVAKSRLHEILESKTIKIAVSPENPGWGIQDKSGERVGYDIDIAKALAKSLGAKAEWVNTDDASRIPLLKTDKADVVIATFTNKSSRAQQVEMTIPYGANTDAVVVVADSPVKTLQDLKGVSVAVSAGSAGESRLKEVVPDAKPVEFNGVADTVQALKSGKTEALVENGTLVHEVLESAPNKYRVLDQSLGSSLYVIGVKEGDPRWINYLNNFIIEYIGSGKAEKSYQQHFKADLPRAVTNW